ncbi:uncharacterized protein KQ657_001219 [Scheffersomyces spartinae]|uniref:Uncharacterized protein n=1 Tax=Scheffersomyces spartinae TaxID=45513 RepID=A0A9P7V937_9ASCO|nr:uncharacterized protein KQ657_001219 [Scheffersomyces spartinae]KAG7193102.1 hypothetical protein KQ657_001219 [Scheffersomyces spartinae]
MTLVLSPEDAGGISDPNCIETPRQIQFNGDDLDCSSLTPIHTDKPSPTTPPTDGIDTTMDTTPGAYDSSEADTSTTSSTPAKKTRRRRRRNKKKNNTAPSTSASNSTTTTSTTNLDTTGENDTIDSITEEEPAGATNKSELSPNPFNILLRSTKSNLNGKYNTTLLEASSVKTIIGISRTQILNLGINDVKIKTIVSKASKLTTNILNFVQKYSDTFFSDFNNQKMFFKLCIYVALYESHGFSKINADFPVLDMIGGYSEITLDTTGTKLTPSTKKQVHQNNLDYAVLAYIGHILIWVLFLQRQARLPLSIEKYDIELSQTTIRQHIGGVHLWSKLIRESATMNAKRWKHIYKFRQMFPFEEDQFMLIVRFMHLEGEIP